MSNTRSAGSFGSDGAWDCSHAFDPSMHHDAWRALGKPSDPEAAINVVARAWSDNYDDDGATWIEANEDYIAEAGCDPVEAFKAWRDGWQARARSYVTHYMTEWLNDEKEGY